MPDRILRALRWTCLLLAALVGWQVYGLVTAPEPLDRLGDLGAAALALETGSIVSSATTGDAATAAEGPSSGGEDAPPASSGNDAESPAGVAAQKSTSPRNGQKKPETSSPPFPATFEIVATSGFLGKLPEQKPAPPALLGTLGHYAMIRAPDGKEDLVAEGGEFGGVKVIRISTNRALVEYQGARMELTVYSGMGSAPLLEPEKKAEEKPQEKRPDAPGTATSPDSSKAPAPPRPE